jgi:hypothetical protein
MVCSECGEPLNPKEVHTHPGPGARPRPQRAAAETAKKAKPGRQAA